MGRRGPRSQADLSVVQTDTPGKLEPPQSITPRARAYFRELVSACDPSHFVASDRPLLTAYSEALALREKAQEGLEQGVVVEGDVNPWYRILNNQDRVLSTLAMRLRLTPHSRYDARAAARSSGKRASAYETKPWEG